jgi:5-methylcytosine-specific restriction endonuclease McrA
MPIKDPAERKIYNAALYQKQREARLAARAAYRAMYPEKVRVSKAASRVKHLPKVRAKFEAWYAANHEDQKRKKREYYAAHRAEIAEQGKLTRARDKAKLRVRKALYAQANKASLQIYIRAWRATHREDLQTYENRRRALKRGTHSDFTGAQWREMQEAYGHRCAYCHRRAKGHLTQDHVTPLSKGGADTVSNIVPACGSCNSKKKAGPPLAPVQPLLFTIAASRKGKRDE